MSIHLLLSLGTIVCLVQISQADPPRLIAQGTIEAQALDKAGETIGGIGSGLAYDAKEKLLVAVSDRGPGDGTIDYCPRFDLLRLTESTERKAALNIEVVRTVLLHDRDGKEMSGLVPDAPGNAGPHLRDGRQCIDPEAIALSPDGTVYISDEYGPMLYQFDRDGNMLRSINPPANYLPRTPNGMVDFGSTHLVSGRVPNHGFEGLALSPDGKFATLILQSGLIQDGGKDARWTRILVIDLATEATVAEYPYEFSDVAEINAGRVLKKKNRVKQNDLSVSEITWLDDRRFLVLERDNFGANGAIDFKPAAHKCLFQIDVRNATNLFSVPGKPYSQLPGTEQFRQLIPDTKVTPVAKELLINFGPPRGSAELNTFASKWEGVALTPPDGQGHRAMILACDNDFLNPSLQIKGRTVAFPRAQRAVATTFLRYDLKLP